MPEFSHQFRAMGTHVGLWLWHTNESLARQALANIEQNFIQLEARLSRFQPTSELSRLNRAAGQPVTVSPLLFDLVEQALRWRKRTGGIFDPTVLNALLAYGYDRSFELIAPAAAHPSPPHPESPPPANEIKLDRARRKITLPPRAGIDLGGIAKGWAVQQAGQILGHFGPTLVDAGGDIVCVSAPPSGSAWLVGVDNPLESGTDLAILRLKNMAVATSSVARRRWQQNGTAAHHLIDPRTGAPADTDLVSVTVIAPRLPDAEIHAKVTLILGRQAGLAYLAGWPDVSALLVPQTGHPIFHGRFKEQTYVYSNDFTDAFVNLG